jgi:hypothetical protein
MEIELLSIDNPQYKTLYESYFYDFISNFRHTRSNPIQIGCRLSTFLYLCFCVFWKKHLTVKNKSRKNNVNIKTLFRQIEKIINVEKDEIYHPLLHDIFIRNAVIENKEIHSIPEFKHIFKDKGVQCLGITSSPIAQQNHERVIFHYFAVRKQLDTYTIVSSYGGEHANIDQYETPLLLSELNTFLKELSQKNSEGTIPFFKKYFLNETHCIQGIECNVDLEIESFYRLLSVTNYYVVWLSEVMPTLKSLNPSGGTRKRRIKTE